MIEIQPIDLQVNQTYYIDMSHIVSPPELISFRKYNRYEEKIKVIFTMVVPANGNNPEYARFYKYTGINSSELDYKYGLCCFIHYRDYKYYFPTRDALLEKRERETVNIVLQNITGDTFFKYL